MQRFLLILISLGFALIFAKPHITDEQKQKFASHVKANDSNMFFVAFNPDDDDTQGGMRNVQKRSAEKNDQGTQTDHSADTDDNDKDGDAVDTKTAVETQQKKPKRDTQQSSNDTKKDAQDDQKSHHDDSPHHQEEEYEEF
ncbi:unnamed protein product, partial [Mesorhabditis belari]|uniref:Secreted protein n=1 Tax=Mesorhabditis belari TaxID=2138241 RepID=A0AAF3FF25_9BILA